MMPHPFFQNKAVLVTGGAGFIGSSLVEQLVHLGAHVTVLDNLSSGLLENLTSVAHDITFINGDVTDLATCMTASQGSAIIFHLAALTSVPESFQQPHHYHIVNTLGTLAILEAARRNKVERVIFSSSAAVYGNREGICSESMPCKPTSPYGYSKMMGELYCQHYKASFGLSTIILRYFNVFGNRQRADLPYASVVPTFRSLMKHNKILTIQGDGRQERDFIPVTFVVDANLNLAQSPDNFIQSEIFNIATGMSISLLELINILKEEFPSYTQSPVLAPARMGDIRRSVADCKAYFSLLDQQKNTAKTFFYGILEQKYFSITNKQ